MKQSEFLQFVQEYVEQNPEVAAYIGDKVRDGLIKSLDMEKCRARDMEVALATSLMKGRGREKIIKGKLLNWQNKTNLVWDWYTNEKVG